MKRRTMNEKTTFTYSSVGEMFRHVLGDEAVRPVELPAKTRQMKSVQSFVRKLEAACLATAGSMMVFK